MSLPGFTAENSLYRTSGQYQVTFAARQNQGMVTAAFVDHFCYTDCYDTCYSQQTYYGGLSNEEARALCSQDCNAQCKCTPYSVTTVDGLCTTVQDCCGSDCTSSTTCIDKTIPIYDKTLFGIYVVR